MREQARPRFGRGNRTKLKGTKALVGEFEELVPQGRLSAPHSKPSKLPHSMPRVNPCIVSQMNGKRKRHNMIMIASDETRGDSVEFMDNPGVWTPALDASARKGFVPGNHGS